MNVTEVTAPNPLRFSCICRDKNSWYSVGQRFYLSVSVFSQWQWNSLGTLMQMPDQDLAWKTLYQKQLEIIGRFSIKTYEEKISVGTAGDWLGMDQRAQDEIRYQEETECNWCPMWRIPSLPFPSLPFPSLPFSWKSESDILILLVWGHWIPWDNTNAHCHCLICLSSFFCSQESKYMSSHIVSFVFPLGWKPLYFSWSWTYTLHPVLEKTVMNESNCVKSIFRVFQ